MKKKNIVTFALTTVLSISVLAGCGSAKAGSETASGSTAASGSAVSGKTVTLKVAASTTPHAEILDHVKPVLAKEGVDLEVKEFEDYVQPNLVVDSGEYDANYFQHITYLNDFNKEKGTDLVDAGDIHYEPFGLYPGKKSDIKDIAEGDSIAIPNDTTNEARALLLLQTQGLIKLKDGAGLKATVVDIAENPKKIKILELEAAQISRARGDAAFVVLNGNYAQEAGLSVKKDAIAVETGDSEAAKNYANVIAVKKGNENNDAIKKLVAALKSEDTQKWINDKYQGAVVPIE